ncbi:MAG: hypothetical protein JWM11_7630 [Planctomycetaceae bacterium]|nr:hypothetical protein [Planctomycetaceae bacterium]
MCFAITNLRDFYLVRTYRDLHGLVFLLYERFLLMFIAPFRALPCLVLIIAVSLTGCGGSKGPAEGTISGKVTLDGKPLEKGAISFQPTDGLGKSAGGKIVNGYYSTTATLGPKKVQIQAPKVVGTFKAYDTPDSPVLDKIEELIPAKYNAQSELKIDVKTGSTTANFDHETPPKPM